MFLKMVDAENRLALAIIMRDAGMALITRCDTPELLHGLNQALGGMRVQTVLIMTPLFGEGAIDYEHEGFIRATSPELWHKEL